MNHNSVAKQPGHKDKDGGQLKRQKSITALKAPLLVLGASLFWLGKAHIIQATCVGTRMATQHTNTMFSGCAAVKMFKEMHWLLFIYYNLWFICINFVFI